MRTLKGFVTERREQLGINQTELAKRAGVPRTTVNRIEQGTTKLPEADIRRKLAKALGVRHVDILVAAGELTEEEVLPLGDAFSGAVRRLAPAIDEVQWSPQLFRWMETNLRFYADPERETAWSQKDTGDT